VAFQDFSGQNLCGRSFKGQDLEGVNFSRADIRGANFTNAYLRGANFSHAQAGLQKYWTIFLVLIAYFCAGISGIFGALDGFFVLLIFSSKPDDQIVGGISLVILIGFYAITIYQGIIAGAAALAGALSLFLALSSAAAVAGYHQFPAGAIAVALSLAGALSLATALAGAVALSLAEEGVLAATGAVALSLVVTGVVTRVLAIAVAGVLALLNGYIAWQAMKGNEKYSWVRSSTIAIAAIGGTSFRNANLTDVDFTLARLKNTDLRKSILIRTNLNQAKMLDRVRPGNTYLQNSQIRQLVVIKQGQDKNFDRLDLRGINLQKANLTDASFIGADLSEANLQDADLSRAKLVQTQLDSTDFTGATLTGAYIQDWGITIDTKFDGVKCEYVYMRLPTKQNPNPLRKPDNNAEVFADGDFGDFIKPIVDTLDLYHNQGVDPRAIAISFKQLAENHPETELRIVGMEVKGEDNILLRAKTADDANKSELSAEYFNTYNKLKELPEQALQMLLAEKDSRIRSLETMVETALQRSTFYSNTQIREVRNMTSNPGGFSIGGSVDGNVNNVQGDGNRVVQGDNSGDNNQVVLGDGNQIAQQNQVGAFSEVSLTKEDVIKLLVELEILVKGADLSPDNKEEIIEDLNAAKNATEKKEPNKKRALERLTTVAETLEKTSKGVEAGHKIWSNAKPIIVKIATYFGAAVGSHLLGL